MTNEKMAQIFARRPDLYPRELEKQFPRVLDSIAKLWGMAECVEYFGRLMIDDRGGRKGFPPEVMSELMLLEKLHSYQYPKLEAGTGVSYDLWAKWRWADGREIDPLELAREAKKKPG